MDKGINRIAIIISGIVLTFSLIYGLWYFNRDKIEVKKEDNSNTITEKDKKDKDTKYNVKEIKLPGEFFSVVNNKYFLSSYIDTNFAQTFAYYDLDGNLVGDKLRDMLHPGLDDNLYGLTFNQTTKELTVHILKKNNIFPVDTIALTEEDYHPIYYTDNDNFSYFLGIVSRVDGVETFFKVNDSSIETIKADGFRFIGDGVLLEAYAPIYTSDSKYVVVEQESKDAYKKVGVFNIDEKKLIIDFDYDNILTIGNDNFIVNIKDKTTIVNSKLKALTLPYDFIMKEGDYFLVARDSKFAIFDKNYKVLTDFVIPFYGNEYNFHPCCGSTNNIVTRKTKDGMIILALDYGTNNEEVYFLTKNNELRSNKINNLYVDNFMYYFDSTTRNYNILSDGFELMYSINLDKYFKGFPAEDMKLDRYGETLVLRNQSETRYFNYEDGEETNGVKDYEIQFTESMKALVHSNLDIGDDNTTVTFYVGDKEYKFVYGFFYPDNVFKKINNKYYFIADSKILQISAK